MSKITNSILMLELLQSGKIYSVKELSNELGVTERMVRYYKEQLELAGYNIQSFKGPGGGYFINKCENFSLNYFNHHDLEVMDNVKKLIDTNDSFDDDIKEKFSTLNHKLHSTYDTNKVLSEYKELDITMKNSDQKIKDIDECIRNKKRLLIGHMGTDGVLTKREIIPISFFEFENMIYVTAFCKLRGDIRQFPLNRIISYEII